MVDRSPRCRRGAVVIHAGTLLAIGYLLRCAVDVWREWPAGANVRTIAHCHDCRLPARRSFYERTDAEIDTEARRIHEMLAEGR